ncbi:P-loop containing nucleoside triphosphate hydrolase protein, partial [Mycena leptocephala]
MHAYFTGNIGDRHVSVLHGLGGAGKTQTALKFIDESSKSGRFSAVFFIDASTLGTLKLSFQGLAVAVQAGNTVEHALRWLIAQGTEWLILFNNADDTGIDLQQFIPGCSHGNILITTRNPVLRTHALDSHHKLSNMEEAEAVELLLRSSLTESSPDKKQLAREIVKELYCFPLAIIQAGAYISKTSVGLQSYLNLYLQNKSRLLKEKPAQTQDGYACTVYTTWEISYNRLSKPAVQLLQLCSLLHHEGITEAIFSNAIHYTGTELGELGPTTEDLKDAREFLAQFAAPSGTWDSMAFLEVIAEIQGYSLIEANGQSGVYSIHPLVHSWTRSVLSD